MVRKMISIFFGFVFLFGLGMVLYPSVSNWVNERNASRVVSSYNEALSELNPEDFTQLKNDAYAHNEILLNSGSLASAVGLEKADNLATYKALLNVEDSGVMAVIRIPEIKVNLPIYHTSEESVLQKAVGHYVGSSLPVGGSGTHCLLTGHRGLPSARLFTDLDQLEEGDMFYIDVLDETLAYQIDSIRTVLPKEVENLDAMPGSDYVTLITCTPYGVNTHRLLVRGSRVPYIPEKEEEKSESPVEKDSNFKMIWIVPIVLIILLIILFIRFRKRGGC